MGRLIGAVALTAGIILTVGATAHASLRTGVPTPPSYTISGYSAAAQAKHADDLRIFYGAAAVIAAEDARWAPTHACEEGGQGWYPAGSTRDGYFEGGLGISAGLYESIAGHSALEDSQYQQELVADIALARVGHGAWACPTP